jgi:hypothetical protein
MNFHTILSTGGKAIDSVTNSFAPPSNATKAQIRKNGLVCVGIGLLSFVIGGGILFALSKGETVALLPIFLGYAFIVVGAYRAVFGKTPAPAHTGEMSITRIGFAVLAIVLAMVSLVGFVGLVVWVFDIK